MKKFWRIFIAILVLLIGGIFFILTYYPRLAQNVLIPEIEHVRSARLELRGDSIFAGLHIRMHNKGPFKLNLDSIIYRIDFDTMRVLSKAQDIEIVLKPGEADTFKLPLALPVTRIKDRILELQHRDSVDIKTDVRLVYSTVLGRISLPHKKTNRIGMLRPPEYEIEKIEYAGRDKKTLRLKAHLKLLYKGARALQVSRLNYRMKVADLVKAEGARENTLNIVPGVPLHTVLPIELDLKRPLKAAYLILTDKDTLPYELWISLKLTGSEKVDQTEIVVTKKGTLELKK